MTPEQNNAFIAAHRLPAEFSRLVADYYAPLTDWVAARAQGKPGFLLGINGAQGTGKTTLAEYLRESLSVDHALRVAVLSLDDFYRTNAERQRLAEDVHPLLVTRGVPGTHDLGLLGDSLAQLRALPATRSLAIPRFDKARDDRAARASWPEVSGPIDLVIFEGWCVGSVPEDDDALSLPINTLEEQHDAAGSWRRYVNEQLRTHYAALFDELDALVFLQAPGFEAIHRWRLEQEQNLALDSRGTGADFMSSDQLWQFIQHYERVTRSNLAALPQRADAVLVLADDHCCQRMRIR